MAWSQALPSPKDIETAVEAGRYTQAEAMLREVLHDKPSSAKAHYELGQVLAKENHLDEGRQELLEAQRLDPSLKFAKSPEKFKETLERVSVAENAQASSVTHAVVEQPSVVRVTQAPVAHDSFPWGYVVLAIGVMFLLGIIVRRMAPQPVVYAPAPPQPYGAPGVGPAPGYGPGYGPGYAPNYGPGYGPSGSGLGGAVVGGLAGVAAGYALSKAMEGSEHQSNAPSGAYGNTGYVPFDQNDQRAPDIGAFDQGSGSGWDDSSSSGSSDDSW
jgi:hypothetical protein